LELGIFLTMTSLLFPMNMQKTYIAIK